MREDYTSTVTCPNCGHNVIVTQPWNHREYVPAGECSKCRSLVWVTFGVQSGNAAVHYMPYVLRENE